MKTYIPRFSLVFDIGAHIGDTVSSFLALGAERVVALEPNKLLTDTLHARYGNEPKVVVHQLALTNYIGELDFYFSTTSTISTACRDWVERSRFSGHHHWADAERVPCTTLDQLIVEYGTPTFIKIDTEGHEAVALQGLTKFVPCCISFEWAEESREFVTIALEHLASLGYTGFSATQGDNIGDIPTEYMDLAHFHRSFIDSLEPARKKLWGMIYATP